MKDLWGMFFTLQIIVYLSFYHITIPANSQIFRDSFKNIIEFELMQPEPLIQIFYPEFNLMAFIKGEKIMVTDKDQEASVLNDLRLYILIAMIGLTILIILSLGLLIAKCKKKVMEILDVQWSKWRYNQLLQSIDIAYLEVVMTAGT